MKLRSKKPKRVIIRIEREGAASTDTVTGSSTLIKEEHVERKEIAEDASEVDPNCRYLCRVCNKGEADFQSMLEHRKSAHNIEFNNASIKHTNLEPVINNPQNYCRACEVEFSSKGRYRTHLTVIHHLWLKSKKFGSTFSMMPDLDDPNFYCCVCDGTYTNKAAYRRHLKQYHSIYLPRLNPLKKEKREKTVYCAYCDYTYTSIYGYNQHCSTAHKMGYPSTDTKSNKFPDLDNPDFYCDMCGIAYQTKYVYKQHCSVKHGIKSKSNPHEVPDALDPNNYCRACNKTLRSKIAYRKHLFIIHNLNFATLANKGTLSVSSSNDVDEHSSVLERKAVVEPDVEDSNYYCRVCKRKYTTRSSYTQHLESIHKMKAVPSCLSSSKSLPDPADPDFYCCVCDVTESSMDTYRDHCKSVHQMALDPSVSRLVNPAAVIDVASPDLYCAQCDYYFSFRNSFESHLKSTHNLI